MGLFGWPDNSYLGRVGATLLPVSCWSWVISGKRKSFPIILLWYKPHPFLRLSGRPFNLLDRLKIHDTFCLSDQTVKGNLRHGNSISEPEGYS